MSRMPATVKIAPSILSADFARLGEEVSAVCTAGADYIHVDVMDGHFVPNITIGPLVVAAVSRVVRSKFPNVVVDTHLMIEKPERYIEEFVKAGSQIVGVHVETCPHLHRTLQQIKAVGAKCCIVVNPATPLAMIEPVVDLADQVLLMTVNPGFGGQKFIDLVLPKVRQLRGWAIERGLDLDIEVDGGVGPANALSVYQAGANVLVAGSAIFGQPDYKAVIAAMRAACQPPEPR